MRQLPTVTLLSGVLVVSACSDLTTPLSEPLPDNPIEDVFRQPTPPQSMQSVDAAFAEIAGRIDGFGGLYFDEQGHANVYMAARPGVPVADPVTLAAQLNAQLRNAGFEATISAAQLVVRSGDYDFAQLASYHRDVVPVLGVPGVVYTDADETTNRLVIGVEPGTSAELIAEVVRSLGVPEDAVMVVETEPILPVQQYTEQLRLEPQASNIGGNPTLRDAIRPIAGGLQIWRLTGPTSASICTLGFNASAPSFSQERLMFTNSHCTAVRGEVDGTVWSQKQLVLPAEGVAVEIEDPPFFTNAENSACPVNRVCRYADAAAGKYTVPDNMVAPARVMAPFPGTLVLPNHRTLRTVQEATTRAIVGQGLMKVGRTSGLTGAAVINTCQNANTAPNITYLCQERVAIDAIGGDSGSPVVESLDNDRAFMEIGPNQRVRLHGLLWGGSANTYVYSSMLNIRMDFPGPWVVTQ
jgi:hypothetical protein